MTPQQALANFERNGEFYLDVAGHRELYKMLTGLVRQARCATAEACFLCCSVDEYGAEYTKRVCCPTCHVWRLVQVIRKEEERDDSKTCD